MLKYFIVFLISMVPLVEIRGAAIYAAHQNLNIPLSYLALYLFVGIPLPGTGAWTGTLAASILDLDFKKSVTAAMGGVVLAGIIMGLVSFLIKGAVGAM